MSRSAGAIVLSSLFALALGSSGCVGPRAHPWRPPGTRPPIHTWTSTYGDFPPWIDDRPYTPHLGQPSDG